MVKQLDVVGVGLGGPENTTLRSNHLLAESAQILMLSFEPTTLEYCAALGREFVDLRPLYTKDRPALEVYRAITDAVVSRLDSGTTVLVVDGNPSLYNSIVRMVRERAEALAVKVNVHPAVSSFDLLIQLLDIKVEDGLQILDVGRMLRDKTAINPAIACLLFQMAGGGATVLSPVATQTSETFIPLRDHLMKFYSPSHPICVVRAARSSHEEGLRIATTIRDFINYPKQIDYDCSAFLPSADKK